jgi:hypothetical protein
MYQHLSSEERLRRIADLLLKAVQLSTAGAELPTSTAAEATTGTHVVGLAPIIVDLSPRENPPIAELVAASP